MPVIILYPIIVLFVYYYILTKTNNCETKIKWYYLGGATISLILQIVAFYMIYQDAVYADEKGLGGNIFGNITANIILTVSFALLAIIFTKLLKSR